MAITNSRRLAARLALVCALLAAAPLCGQSAPGPYALIFGTLWSPTNHPVYGVRMKLRLADQKKFRWEAFSDHRGEFAFRVPAGKADYILVPDVKHAKGTPLPETRIHVENDERVDIGVHLEDAHLEGVHTEAQP